jgi:serine/threonine protein phosphatase 1
MERRQPLLTNYRRGMFMMQFMQFKPTLSRLLVISDIHGHEEGLAQLLHRADYSPQTDKLILLGDYVDTDPSTWRTLDTVVDLVSQGAVALQGNAERSLLASGPDLAGRLSPHMLDWMERLPLYWSVETYLFVHAGIRHGVPLERQTAEDLTEIRDDFWNREPAGGQTVVFGHTPTFKLGSPPGELWFAPGRIGIDCGAKHGKRLALLDLRDGVSYSCSTNPERMYTDWRVECLKMHRSASLSDR